jgi:hypothetical protein
MAVHNQPSRSSLVTFTLYRRESEMEIPKAMIVEKIRSRSGPDMANQADKELPDKIDTDTDAELLSKYDIDPDELHDEHGGQSPAAT